MCAAVNVAYIRTFLNAKPLEQYTIGFVPTAGNCYSDPHFVEADRRRLADLKCPIVDIDIEAMSRDEIIAATACLDAIYMAGGNTFYLLQELQRKDIVGHLADIVKNGLPYIGASAGAVILAPTVDYVSAIDEVGSAPDLKDFDGMDLVRFSPLPHYGDPKYLDVYHQILRDHVDTHKFVLLRDDQVLLTEDGDTYCVATSGQIEG
jgi:dipeptidase E